MWALMVQAVPAVSASTSAIHTAIAIQFTEVTEVQAIDEVSSIYLSAHTTGNSHVLLLPGEGVFASLREVAPALIPRAGPIA